MAKRPATAKKTLSTANLKALGEVADRIAVLPQVTPLLDELGAMGLGPLAEDLAARHAERHVLHRRESAEALGQALDVEQRGHGVVPLPSLRHSGATRVAIRLHRKDEQIALAITDNGVGGADSSSGMGLANMRARAEGLPGGHFELISTPGAGTEVRVRCIYGAPL